MTLSTTTFCSSLLLHSALSCKIQGTESGVCTYRYLPSTYQDGARSELEAIQLANQNWAKNTEGPCRNGESDHCMPFCGKYIANYYPPCVPKNTRAKDQWIENEVKLIIESRIELEKNKQAKRRFYKNKACQDAYEKYFCWANFPRCDEFEETLPLCSSVCENFFRICGYDEDMWMCDKTVDSELLEVEDKKQTPYFPGEPFKKNEYETKDRKLSSMNVCTPSIQGSSSHQSLVMSISLVAIVVCLQLAIF